MLLNVRPQVDQLVQVLINSILKNIFAVRVILVEGWQYVRPFELLAERCRRKSTLLLVIIRFVLTVCLAQRFRIE